MENETFKLAELTDSNWRSWSIKLEAYFDVQDLWEIVKKAVPVVAQQDEKWEKSNPNLIKLRVSNKFVGVVNKCTTAIKAYKQLKQYFEGSGNSKMTLLSERFFQLKVNYSNELKTG